MRDGREREGVQLSTAGEAVAWGGGGDEKRGDRERGACVTSPCKEEGARKVRMGDGGLRWGGRVMRERPQRKGRVPSAAPLIMLRAFWPYFDLAVARNAAKYISNTIDVEILTGITYCGSRRKIRSCIS